MSKKSMTGRKARSFKEDLGESQMEWFRHFSDADTSIKLNNLIDKMGVKGYGQYWLLFGLLNKKFDGIDASSIKVHENEILGRLRLRYVGPMREVLGTMAGLELFQYSRDERVYFFDCPMLLELLSKDSKYNRKLRLCCDRVANPRVKNKIKNKEEDIINKQDKKNLSEIESQTIPKTSPLSFLFVKDPGVQNWLNEGSHDTHAILLAKHPHDELIEIIEKAFIWASKKNAKAENWLLTFTVHQNTSSNGSNKAQKRFNRGGAGITSSKENPTGDPFLQEAIDKGLVK